MCYFINTKNYMIKTINLTKNYNGIDILKKINIKIDDSEFVSIMGASGSGKTTLLNCISTIDNDFNGKVLYDGKDISNLSENEIMNIRANYISFVFQDYNLLDRLSIFDNIALALTLDRINYDEIKLRVEKIAYDLGVNNILYKYPSDISGGEKQRVAFARAFISNPKFLIADEPTGALDSKSSKKIMELLKYLNKQYNTSILVVTHDDYIASYSNRVIFIKDGQVSNEIFKKENFTRQCFHKEILENVEANIEVL